MWSFVAVWRFFCIWHVGLSSLESHLWLVNTVSVVTLLATISEAAKKKEGGGVVIGAYLNAMVVTA